MYVFQVWSMRRAIFVFTVPFSFRNTEKQRISTFYNEKMSIYSRNWGQNFCLSSHQCYHRYFFYFSSTTDPANITNYSKLYLFVQKCTWRESVDHSTGWQFSHVQFVRRYICKLFIKPFYSNANPDLKNKM